MSAARRRALTGGRRWDCRNAGSGVVQPWAAYPFSTAGTGVLRALRPTRDAAVAARLLVSATRASGAAQQLVSPPSPRSCWNLREERVAGTCARTSTSCRWDRVPAASGGARFRLVPTRQRCQRETCLRETCLRETSGLGRPVLAPPFRLGFSVGLGTQPSSVNGSESRPGIGGRTSSARCLLGSGFTSPLPRSTTDIVFHRIAMS